ncbi:amidohydrolase family protein [Luteibacter aegosomatissinici]|uniref:amidohydrolase family protein n=1 Tax=Luteibacter aegosomatissinici TaxID=2911539 RepID=UPI001FF91B19|nr:amidohydrolase family protein [Luteibacter aegosomatissinici]UPG95185.1 amidohydrolase family protein [Luteibacter aegosomatissinici]
MSARHATGAVLRGALSVTAQGVSRHAPALSGAHFAARPPRRAVEIDLRGHIVVPGLINGHEHLQVNCVPPLPGGTVFPNSYAWIDAFQAHFEAPAVKAALAVPKAVRLRHGALKNLLAGTTCVVHHDPWHDALDAVDFPVSLLRGHGWSYALGGPSYGPPVRESYAATPSDRPWIIHLAEGSDTTARGELDALEALGCFAANSVLVHGVGLGEEGMARVVARGAAVVWCPASNRNLLGTTLDPRVLVAAGRLALGSDSRLSGARDLLDEMCGIRERDELPAPALLGTVTTDAARIFGLPSHGSLAEGACANFMVIATRGGADASALDGIRRADLRAVVHEGRPCIADPDFAHWFDAAGIDTVPVTLDGRPKLVDARLADPEVMALEPGFERAGRMH